MQPKDTPTHQNQDNDVTLEISHIPSEESEEAPSEAESAPPDEQEAELPEPVFPSVEDVKQNTFEEELSKHVEEPSSEISAIPASRMMLQPPSMGGTLTANSMAEQDDNLPDLLAGQPAIDQPLLSHKPSDDTASSSPAVEESQGADIQSSVPLVSTPPPEVDAQVPELPQIVTPTEPASSPIELETPEPANVEPSIASPSSPPLTAVPPSDPLVTNQIHIDETGNLQMGNSSASSGTDEAQVSAPLPLSTDELKTETLTDLEAAVHSPHLLTNDADAPDKDLEAARDAVMSAINSLPPSGPPEPKADLAASGYLNVQTLPGSDDGVLTMSSATPPPPAEPPVPDLTDATASLPREPPAVAQTPSVQPVSSFGPFVEPSSVTATATPPPVPPPLPLDDLTKFTNPSTPANS